MAGKTGWPESQAGGRSTSRKRKQSITREEEVKRLEDELEQVRLSMEELWMEIKEEGVHGKTIKKETPVVETEWSPVKNIIVQF